MIKKILQILGVIFIIEIVVVLGFIVKKYSESKIAVLNYHNVLAKEELPMPLMKLTNSKKN